MSDDDVPIPRRWHHLDCGARGDAEVRRLGGQHYYPSLTALVLVLLAQYCKPSTANLVLLT